MHRGVRVRRGPRMQLGVCGGGPARVCAQALHERLRVPERVALRGGLRRRRERMHRGPLLERRSVRRKRDLRSDTARSRLRDEEVHQRQGL